MKSGICLLIALVIGIIAVAVIEFIQKFFGPEVLLATGFITVGIAVLYLGVNAIKLRKDARDKVSLPSEDSERGDSLHDC